MDISFIIPAYNEETLLGATLRSVNHVRTELGERTSEVIVVDNNSTDATPEIARAAGAEVVFAPRNCIAGARNAGARQARGRFFFFVDADTLIPTNLVTAALAALDSGTICGGGTTVAFDRARLPFAAHCFAWFWHRLIRIIPMAAGSFIFCRREAWIDVGGFDERVYASEEVWFSRAVAHWGRRHQQRFVILDIPVVTSARKLDQYSPTRMIAIMFLIACFPPLVRSRRVCHLWYERQEAKPVRMPNTTQIKP
jgi:glycosyltransferase involved in cell wall biosynthesis